MTSNTTSTLAGLRADSSSKLAQSLARLGGRVALAWIFIDIGFGKFNAIERTVAYMQKFGLPMADSLVWPGAAVELLGGLALALGWKTRWAAAALAVFVLITMFVFHAYWAVEASQFVAQRIHFLKNLALFGALVFVASVGPGRYSVDALLSRQR